MPESKNLSGKTTKALGICLGASTISLVRIEKNSPENFKSSSQPRDAVNVIDYATHSHAGNPKHVLASLLSSLDLTAYDRIAATGRRFRHFVNFSSISEPEAVEYAYQFVKTPKVESPAVVSAGGETFMVYVLNRNGLISNVLTGNKCASGTGEFFNQQLRRMNVSMDEALRWSSVENPYEVSGRCSVFCKSDCTHAINKGIPKSRVTAGLCRMMASKVLELLKKVEKKNIMIVGGTTRNQMMIDYLKQEIPSLLVPEEAPYFEALGAALWALNNEDSKNSDITNLFNTHVNSFEPLPRLKHFQNQVIFNSMSKEIPRPGDVCILGLDVGSTTTKAVLMRRSDNSILASIYLLTDGDPVGASKKCYQGILKQIQQTMDPSKLSVTGLGVCGSGRQIAGLHALTDGVINEIIAHATAAVYFDPEVDTLFEIGGQDAKYTYITSGVPSDYAMNEACSAGTGSFLEEAAYETLDINVEDIAAAALQGNHPPNFNDQCAAFISSDIKTAIHEGIGHNDIIAGLVYSICMNYINRVKGNRPMGKKIFMQGGVCYNQAVPLAMASLTGKKIIVPPEPGLMGAYGAALEIKKRIDIGLLKQKEFDLHQLSERSVHYGRSFICEGGREKCDRRCEINMIELEGKKYPFGGACNRYYNIRYKLKYDLKNLDLVRAREKLIFNQHAPWSITENKKPFLKTVGVNKSFLVNSLYPFYQTFFNQIGFRTLIPESPSKEGIDQRNAAFCYPAELAHGFFHTMIQNKIPPDFIFLPHIRSIPIENGTSNTQACPFVQGEPFYLKSAFHQSLQELKQKGTTLLTPFINMPKGLLSAKNPMIQIAKEMGVHRKKAEESFNKALNVQRECNKKMMSMGQRALSDLESDPEKIAIVIFGRPYNAMVEEAHMGIPHKFASRGVQIIPFDFLPFENEKSKRHMYWGMGQMILKAARFVQKHPQLFATYITNFSCGPDSFLITYFRSIMGRKPSLTLELDSHTADAGLETRIEAFLDIIKQYRQIILQEKAVKEPETFTPAQTFMKNGSPTIKTSAGNTLLMTDPKVTLLIPSMGRISTLAISAVFSEAGYHLAPIVPADESILKLGRANTSGKECLPLILTTGTLLNYVYNKKQSDEILVYFMPSASGPCRFGQYSVYMEDLIKRLKLPDVAIYSLTSDNTYSTMGKRFNNKKAWCGIIISDIMEDFHAMLLANAKDPGSAISIFNDALESILNVLKKGNYNDLILELTHQMKKFSEIPVKKPYEEVPKILLTGEIFARRDAFSRQNLSEQLAEIGFAVVCSPVSEWFRYSDYLLGIDGHWASMSMRKKMEFFLRQIFMNRYEKRLTSIFSSSGILHAKPVNLQKIIDSALPHMSEQLTGEAILTVGSSLDEVASEVCGVIALGPFGCMPNRLSEAILNETMTREVKITNTASGKKLEKVLENMDDLPFLAIETDGSPFPQLINAKLESFCQRAQRLHHRMIQFK
ncbi:MAG: activase [Desulfobacteraceae bacterium]|nr:activase [Desulfobacteraceae bacterium]MBC2756893.1 activase [Desulfobacteraceae bacterium]